MTSPAPRGRRERLRTATIAEIKRLARELLISGGPAAISLRAIAREMGMTPSGLYRYYPSLNALVDDLCGDLFDDLHRAVQTAGDATAGDDPTRRMGHMARGFRRWALDHPAEFGLMLGPRPSGVTTMWADRDQPHESTLRFGSAFLNEFAAMWRQRGLVVPPDDVLERDLRPHLGRYMQRRGDEGLPLGVVFTFLTAWTRLYGLVAMEVFGHMRWALADAQALFELELGNFVQQVTGMTTAAGAVA